MKSYSNDAITRDELNLVDQSVSAAHQAVSFVDQKQTRQIVMLRWAIGLSFVVNALLAVAMRFV
jgi:hypothetical protein